MTTNINLSLLVPSSDNVRTEPEPESTEDGQYIDQLASNIEQYGLLHPLTVRATPTGRYEVVAGLRRLEAIKLLGWSDAPCNVLSSAVDPFQVSFVENMQRFQMTHKEKCKAMARFLQAHDGNVSKVARVLNVTEGTVRKYAKIAELDDETLDRLDAKTDDRLTLKDALALAARMLAESGGSSAGAAGGSAAAESSVNGSGGSSAGESSAGGSSAGGSSADGTTVKKPRKPPVKSNPWVFDADDNVVPIPPALYAEVHRLVMRHQNTST